MADVIDEVATEAQEEGEEREERKEEEEEEEADPNDPLNQEKERIRQYAVWRKGRLKILEGNRMNNLFDERLI